MRNESKNTTENTQLTKLPSGHGHWKVIAESQDRKESFITDDAQWIDDAFNSDEGDTSYYDSVDEARQAFIDHLFGY